MSMLFYNGLLTGMLRIYSRNCITSGLRLKFHSPQTTPFWRFRQRKNWSGTNWHFGFLTKKVTGLIFLAAIWILTSTSYRKAIADQPTKTSSHISAFTTICGPHSLYLFLRLLEVNVSYERITKYYPSDPEGMSLLDLKVALNDFGVDAVVMRCSNAEVTNLCLPAIIPVKAGLTTSKHHYVVITEIANQQIRAIDSTSGRTEIYDAGKIGNVWDGYVLVARARGSAETNILDIALLMLLALQGIVAAYIYIQTDRSAAAISNRR